MSFDDFQGFLSSAGLPGRHTAEEMGRLKIIERTADDSGEFCCYRLGPKGPEAIEEFERKMNEIDLTKRAEERAIRAEKRAENAERDSAIARRQARLSNFIAFASALVAILALFTDLR